MRKVLVLIAVSFILFSGSCLVSSLLFAEDREMSGSGKEESLISLDVKDMELVDIIRMIADQSKCNVITSKNVRGKMSITLQNIGVERALELILKVNNCTYIKENDVIQVYTLPEFKQMEQNTALKTKVYSLQYVRATDLKNLLVSLKSTRGKIEIEPKTNCVVVTDTVSSIAVIGQTIKIMDKKLETKAYRLKYADCLKLRESILEIMPEGEGEVFADERTNSLVITASPLLLDKVEVLIQNWDKRVPQVLIEAKIIQITLEKGRFLGIDWQYLNSDKHSVGIGAKDLPIPTGVTYINAFRVGILAADDYEITLRALESLSNAHLISSPRIVTLDNEEARILIGSSEPYEVLHYDTEGHLTTKEVKFVEVGIKLTVTPRITEDGFITMNIHPEVSSPRKGTVTDALAIDSTEATTVLRVKNGDTVALGGLIKDEDEEHVFKVPLLGDIPLLGKLFQNTYTKRTKKEIVIFITPKILADKETLSVKEEKLLKNCVSNKEE